jgi:hypothetical protein
MGADETFQKALLLLDRGDVLRGEKLLREVVATAEEGRGALYYRACCCLGELLVSLGRRDEAAPLLELVAALAGAPVAGTLAYEVRRAKGLLAT